MSEINNKLALHRLHAGLVADELTSEDLEMLCLAMYKMGFSPVTILKKYIVKYDADIDIKYVNVKTYNINEIPKAIKGDKPVLLVYLKETTCGMPIAVKLKYYPAMKSLGSSKYEKLNMTSILLKK